MISLQPPFLELAYFVGKLDLAKIAARLSGTTRDWRAVQQFNAPGIAGLAGEREQLRVNPNGVITAVTEGEIFCGPHDKFAVERKAAAKVVRDRFLELAGGIDPFYGAILGEQELPLPSQICRGIGAESFLSFYVGEKLLRREAVRTLRTQFVPMPLVQELDNGCFLSFSRIFGDVENVIDEETALRNAAQILTVLSKLPALRRLA